MRRIIEELIERRKKGRQDLSSAMGQLAEALENKSLFNRRRGAIASGLQRLGDALDEWVTSQDREWNAYVNHHATTVFRSLQWKIDKLEAEYSLVKTLLANFTHLERALDGLIASVSSQISPQALQELQAARDQLSVFQYSGFEDRFRGESTAVREKLKKYLPYFSGRDADAAVLDLGCGRGEFLELLAEQGQAALGVDISESMLNQAREKGLPVRHADALTALQQTAPDSLAGIFAAQVIEHFTADYLRRVIPEAYRVLKSGSWLIMETINPLSLFAVSRIFFLDPSHEKPLHPEYMRYLLESAGFAEVSPLFAAAPDEEKLETIAADQPNALAFNRNVDKLNELLFTAPEFAIAGRKP